MGGHHGHSHGHDHGHARAPTDFGSAFAIGIALNVAFVAIEAAFGLAVHSMALLADAGHNLSDVLGLAVAWGGARLARAAPSKRYTYGLKGSTILAALTNALLLLVALGAIALESVQRIGDPAPVAGATVSAVAAAGIAVNGLTAWLFARGRHGDVNVRGAYLHMLSDAVVSAGVVVAGLAIWSTGAEWVDPAISLVIVGVIFWQTWQLLHETVEMALAAVPRDLDYDRVEWALGGMAGVKAVHDLHIWPMSTTETVLTAHLVMPDGAPGDAFLAETQRMLHVRFGIDHATIQVETGRGADCVLEDPGRV